MSTSAIAARASVAPQQKLNTAHDYSDLSNGELHKEMLDTRNKFYRKCVATQHYGVDVLLPYCEEIIRRYKMQGVAAKNRPNGKPTVDAYFKSIGLNYNNVRSWIHRKKLQTEMFKPKERKGGDGGNKNETISSLTALEARLLGTASAGHDLVKAIKRGGNVDDAIKEFEDHAPTPERIEEYIERPVKVVTTEVETLALQLCKLIDDNDGRLEQTIRALAKELLTKLDSATVQQADGRENKCQHRKDAEDSFVPS